MKLSGSVADDVYASLIGQDIATENGKRLAVKTLKFMLEQIKQYQAETGHIYNLEATPAEGTSYRLAKIDKHKYPDITTAGENAPYYTNSTWLPVGHELNIVEAMRHQEGLQVLYTGGTVFHIFLGEAGTDPEGCKILFKRTMNFSRMPYFTFTPTYSICPDHGYLSGEYFKCPHCGRSAEVYSRVVGYYRPVRDWNAGKREEFRQRKKYALTGVK